MVLVIVNCSKGEKDIKIKVIKKKVEKIENAIKIQKL